MLELLLSVLATARVFFRPRAEASLGTPLQSRMGAMTVMVPLELEELQLQVGGRLEEQPVQAFPPNRADQEFDKGMRERHARHRLDLVHVEDPQVRLPLVAFVQPRASACQLGPRHS
jgi:hypothetical protein